MRDRQRPDSAPGTASGVTDDSFAALPARSSPWRRCWGAAASAPRRRATAFRPCIDPGNLPFANIKGEGFENRIAELFAQQLGLPVKNYAFPQRMNFIRNTLRYKLPGEDFRCDIVMSVPAGYDQVSATTPYYRSTYALVYPKGKGLDEVRSGADLIALPSDRRSQAENRNLRQVARIGVAGQARPGSAGEALSDAVAGSRTVSRGNHREGPGAGQDRRRDRLGSDRRLLRQARAQRGAGRDSAQSRNPASNSTMRSQWASATASPNGRRPCRSSSAKIKAAITAILREYNVPLVNERGEPIE